MPILAQRQTEAGVQVETLPDVDSLLPAVERVGASRFRLIRYIDAYGDTTFNHLMMPDVLADLDQLLGLGISREERDIAERLRMMATKCVEEPHIYLKFIGD